MGVSLSTARVLAPASFLYDFAAQQYGIFNTPSLKDVHDAHLSFFSPNPFFIGGFFFPQQFIQLAWLYSVWKGQGQQEDVRQALDYVPVYALGNVCIGTWMFFWVKSDLSTANIFVIVNSAAQLLYLATRLRPLRTDSSFSWLTHAVAKTFAGIGVLDLLHNSSVAYFDGAGAPGTAVQVLTGVGFALASAASDWIFGGCLVYDLIALSVGQRQRGQTSWANLLAVYAAGCAGIVGLRNWF